nr:hypothetical protein [Tanacetum cinerariifolium]
RLDSLVCVGTAKYVFGCVGISKGRLGAAASKGDVCLAAETAAASKGGVCLSAAETAAIRECLFGAAEAGSHVGSVCLVRVGY